MTGAGLRLVENCPWAKWSRLLSTQISISVGVVEIHAVGIVGVVARVEVKGMH